MGGLFFLLIVVGVIVLSVLWSIAEGEKCKVQIEMSLRQRGATAIEISWGWSGGERSTRGYVVNYTDRWGRRQQTECKLYYYLGSCRLYWLDDPEFCADAQQVLEGEVEPSTDEDQLLRTLTMQNVHAQSSGAKDQLIARLLERNKRLLADLKQRRGLTITS